MLRIFYGRAGTGKTAAVMNEIKSAGKTLSRCLMIVPEQYSHGAERELCSVCGDSLSLYGEVLSFTGLYRKLNSEFGGCGRKTLDKGGRLLCMALVAESLSTRLKVYAAAKRRTELLNALLREIDMLKSACISPEMLRNAAADCDGILADKLTDLSLVLEGYDAVTSVSGLDPSDRLSMLAETAKEHCFGKGLDIYIDGFTDFTAQERRIIETLLLNGARLCICLDCDDVGGGSEVFEPGRMTIRHFLAFAADHGIEASLTEFSDEGTKDPALRLYSESVFEYSSDKSDLNSGCIGVFAASGIAAECEFAAANALHLVRDEGCRYRDIAIAVRGFEDYRPELEDMLSHYGVPFYSTRKTDMFSKPLPALISAAYEIIGGGWEPDDIFDYLRSGLAGLEPSEIDELENYVIMWGLYGNAWKSDEPWRLHPDGFGKDFDDISREKLNRINELRSRAAAPLLAFEERSSAALTAIDQARALAMLFSELSLCEQLDAKTRSLRERGEGAKAQEYAQLWDICSSALKQCASVLGDAEVDSEYFGRLFLTVLSKYDIGSIPALSDAVTIGDFDRVRRRKLRHLIVLGADDERLPAPAGETGLFSDDERERLLELDIDLGGMGDSELWREFSLIYSCLSQPSESLCLVYSAFDRSGEAQRPSIVFDRAVKLFGLRPKPVRVSQLRLNAAEPLLSSAAAEKSGVAEATAAEICDELFPRRMARLRAAAEMRRGSLSPTAVRALYGDRLRLSASKIDLFASCRFGYFMRYGLNAKTREPAGFTPPELGIFMHSVLERTASAVMESGGFKSVTDEELEALTDRFVGEYIHEKLNDFRERSPRFVYLFRRLIRDVRRIVLDTAKELRESDFVPLNFELDMGNAADIPPVSLGSGEDTLTLTGIVDRVDGWMHDGRLYLRVVDYKTGKKSFSLSDVYYGMNLQMLLYLFSLCKNGETLYGVETVPAGVLYVPARDVVLTSNADMSPDEAEKKRSASLRRSGLMLSEPEVLRAMEHSDTPKYIPLRGKGGALDAESLASAEQLGALARHIERTLTEMAGELKRGSIAADPFYRSQQETACTYCKYLEACRFTDGENGECHRRLPHLAASRVWNYIEGGEDNG